MAQRAKIGINGDPLGFDEQLDRIQTPGIGGGNVTWLPEADTRCETLNVTANGTYSAQQAGKYGYDYVTVSVPGSSVTGKDPATGEEVVVRPDPETGEIVKELLPVRIEVTTPPTKTEYTHGETIDYSGIVVHAYSSQGVDMGAVPFNELVFPETTASDDLPHSAASASSDFDLSPLPNPLSVVDYSGTSQGTIDYGTTMRTDIYEINLNPGTRFIANTRAIFAVGLFAAADRGEAASIRHRWYDVDKSTGAIVGEGDRTRFVYASEGPYTYDGKTAYYNDDGAILANLDASPNIWFPLYPYDDISLVDEKAAWTMLYGDYTPSGYAVLVQWPRPQDGAVLETSFNITVTGGSNNEQP